MKILERRISTYHKAFLQKSSKIHKEENVNRNSWVRLKITVIIKGSLIFKYHRPLLSTPLHTLTNYFPMNCNRMEPKKSGSKRYKAQT